MAAHVLSRDLGLDLYRIDLSQMVSKYIGETEKNISALFRRAKNINAILFFDEADTLFSKRTEVKDSHDRNANAETGHLLQQFEDYEGIVLLSTNYMSNLDPAFKRRIKYTVPFAMPEKDERLRLWNTLLPDEAKRDETLNLRYFADNFELSGSGIKEVLINAAYLVASENRGLTNRGVAQMLKMTCAKNGRILTRADCMYL
jgi:SpoVK/Ycf46/Vps4 family AAA+-type ATPase